MGRMPARLYQFRNYPGAVASEKPGDWVAGELYELIGPGILPALDDYEGAEFVRVVVTVSLDAGHSLEAWVYLLRHAPTG